MTKLLLLVCLLGAISCFGLAARDTYTMRIGKGYAGGDDGVWREGPERIVATTLAQRIGFSVVGLVFVIGAGYLAPLASKGK